MLLTTLNMNGIRAAERKGFFPWLEETNPDFVCLQETRVQDHQMSGDMQKPPGGYHAFYQHAEKPGYSGVGIYSKRKPDRVITKLGWEPADREGRFIQADYGKLSIVSVYVPSGSSGEVRQAFKYEFLEVFQEWLITQKRKRRQTIICGDFNIAHKKIDIKNWRSNQKNSGFLPEERAWMSSIYDDGGYVDVFRQLNQDEAQYTWWSNRGQAWANNTGWRLDYQIATPKIAASCFAESIYKDSRFSDHAPFSVHYDWELTD